VSAPKGNRYASREVKRTSRLHLALTPREKAKVVRDAGGRKLSAYVRERLGLDSENTEIAHSELTKMGKHNNDNY